MPASTTTPLVLINGSGDSHICWMRQIAALPAGTALAADLPGHGDRIDDPAAPTTVAAYAADMWTQLESQGIANVGVAGHSLGGAIALQMALDRPDRVVALGLIGTGARLRVLPDLLATAQADPQAALRQLLLLGYSDHLSPEALRVAIASFLPIAPGAISRDLHACDRFDVMTELGRVRCPTLVVVGEHDQLTPVKYARYLADHIPHARLLIIAGAGHYVMHEQPEQLTAALRELQQAS
jgi:pimeloyl-ACP methyl ester carboxylesterase